MLTILQCDALTKLKTLPAESVHCCVTSPPYWGLRDYGVGGQLGLEKTPSEYVSKMVEVFREVRRVLREDGTLWLNMGDCYATGAGSYRNPGSDVEAIEHGGKQAFTRDYARSQPNRMPIPGLKPKDLVGIPWRVAFALQADGWWLRSDIIWAKPNPMPESVTDRPTKSHEFLFLLAKSERYYYDSEAIKTPASESYALDSRWETGPTPENEKSGYRDALAQNPKAVHRVFNGAKPTLVNRRSVWTVPTAPYKEAHFATFPPDLVKPCILAGTSAKGCCPECGAPWERVVDRIDQGHDGSRYGERVVEASGGALSGGTDRSTLGSSGGTLTGKTETTGWVPTCGCSDMATVPAVVLDPFFGSGTVGEVSLELGRRCVGIELNPKYVELARQRCQITPGLALA